MMALQAHAMAKLFPEIPEEEFKQIVLDIKAHGLLEPIWTFEGKVLDGWHRYKACLKAGVEPKLKEWKGKDPWAFVVSMNIMRRHLSVDQRVATVALAAKVAGVLLKVEPGDVASQVGDGEPEVHRVKVRSPVVAELAGCRLQTASKAVRVADARPDLAKKVADGQMSLAEANAVVSGDAERVRKAKKDEHKERKKHEENPREVAEFLEATKEYSEQVATASGVVKFGKFSPEAAKFTARKLGALTDKIARLSAMLEAVQ